MKLYIVDYWVPFPTSEYGGIEIYIAKNKVEVFDMIVAKVSDYQKERWPTYENIILEMVSRAKEFELAQEYPSELIAKFTT